MVGLDSAHGNSPPHRPARAAPAPAPAPAPAAEFLARTLESGDASSQAVDVDAALHVKLSGMRLGQARKREAVGLGGEQPALSHPVNVSVNANTADAYQRRVSDCARCILMYRQYRDTNIWDDLKNAACIDEDHGPNYLVDQSSLSTQELDDRRHQASPSKGRSRVSPTKGQSRASPTTSTGQTSPAKGPTKGRTKGPAKGPARLFLTKGKGRAVDSDDDSPAGFGESVSSPPSPVKAHPTPSQVRPSQLTASGSATRPSQPPHASTSPVSKSATPARSSQPKVSKSGRSTQPNAPTSAVRSVGRERRLAKPATIFVAESDVQSSDEVSYESSEPSERKKKSQAWNYYVVTAGLQIGIFKDWTKVKPWCADIGGDYTGCDTLQEARKIYNHARRDGRLCILELK